MIINSRNLFYVRKIQINFYFRKNKFISSLFELEGLLFQFYTVKSEIFLANIKLKWLYDQFNEDKPKVKSIQNLENLFEKPYKRIVQTLINNFSDVINSSCKQEFLVCFKKFNQTFNSILNLAGEKFKTSDKFQLLHFSYFNNHHLLNYDDFLKTSKVKIDITEKVFIDVFLKNCNHKKKISKINYLFKLLLGIVKK